MDTPIIVDPNPNREANRKLDHPSTNSHSSTFLLHNGFGSSQISDIEMITIQSVSYTSLKDLLPTSPLAITSPTHNSSWHEIPIKNPLVKHAALAYLQPMSSPPEVGEKGLFGRLKERCCGECGCVLWLHDVIWRNVKEAFWERREEVLDDDDDYYDDYEEKVD
ncbi:PREDICTED: uncharacterized protein LOC18607496 [Theobroma cacao]|uniref:Uncharacterized protein LOC18607496 n=1 Tax=Theobroma cacao TaxID=3641 RepID=A0AB32VIA2_THECC|nr:PREDICTED: uncharacterized protein LOC18607496 [Theobroma cacao]